MQLVILMLRLIRGAAGVLFITQIVQAAPALTWLSAPDAVSDKWIAFLALKVIICALAGAVFFVSKPFINKLAKEEKLKTLFAL